MRPTTPGPISGMDHQPTRDWIQMHVIQFLSDLFSAPDVEIVETPHPEMRFRSRILASNFIKELSGYALFQYLKEHRGIAFHRFRYEEMNMLRHHDVPDQAEGVSIANFGQDSDQAIAG